MTGLEILNLPMEENDADASTIKEYLIQLLTTLWAEGESFSGKRPFGNSGWEYDLYKPLVAGGAVSGEIDEYGDLNDVNRKEANRAIFDAIEAL